MWFTPNARVQCIALQRLPQRRHALKAFINVYQARRAVLSNQSYSAFAPRGEAEATVDGRARLSGLWIPTGGIAAISQEDSHSKLIRAGFIRQAHSGIFHLLPLGRRVQDKLETLIDKHMHELGASRLALSSISSQEIWSKSGRLASAAELFRFRDRKDIGYLLSPTHEEEITSLVSAAVKSYKELPIRLYQISRKYRDELRPRHGVLRSREFVMKDLYTFDYRASLALATYQQVREAYSRLFDELKIPYLVAEADSGDMGGHLSHEFHFPTSMGEDHIISCNKCDYVVNEELAESRSLAPDGEAESRHLLSGGEEGCHQTVDVWRGVSRDRLTLINVWYSSTDPRLNALGGAAEPKVNTYAIKSAVPDFDASIEDSLSFWPDENAQAYEVRPGAKRLINLIDCRLHSSIRKRIESAEFDLPLWPFSTRPYPKIEIETLFQNPFTAEPLNLLKVRDGDCCPRCPDGVLKVQKGIELAHTFYLGTRYSEPLVATVAVPKELLEGSSEGVKENGFADRSPSSRQVPMEMGCYGIGVSRMIGAVADSLADKKGLNWPRVMAPFEVVVVPGNGLAGAASEVYDILSQASTTTEESCLDLVLDDRNQSFPWKMQDADLVGYPIIVVIGRRWKGEKICEIQCRRLKVRQEVHVDTISSFVRSLLAKL